jgi:hypothetical protein
MCYHHVDKSVLEDEILFILCEECLTKVKTKLEGTGKTLSDLPPEAYEFCRECLAKIER